ncbi:sialoadhesin-like [Salvelinus fontinalis]|uniref:sialoadhesin-like n=1 Tax=Salvelinus fontinalis TaxID=8038 RepID=UPI0024855B98|nr:sialoadhesin-like [Salvelinus fontinalis]
MSLRTAGSVLVVFLWSVAVVLGQDGWSVTYTPQRICALRGSTVDLSCSYTYPRGTVTTTLWFTKWGTGVEPEDMGQDPEYTGRLEYHGDKKKDCTLRITDLRERDSATYRLRLITDQEGGTYTGKLGVTLSVTGLQVKVTGEHQDKTLTCITTCTLTDNPTYIWYKNGQHLDESTSPQYKDPVSSNYDDSYSCAVKGHEDLRSPAVCVLGQSCYRVTYTKRTICVLKGTMYEQCVTYCPPDGPKNTSVSVSPSGEIVEGSSVTLTCSSDANPPVDKYTWYKKNVTSAKASEQSYSITNIKSEDRGEYYCEAQNGRGSMNSTALMIIVVIFF